MNNLRRDVRNANIPKPPAGLDVRDYCRNCGHDHGGSITCSEAAEIRQ